MNASTTSGAMNSAEPTGVSKAGVEIGEVNCELNLMPEPRSKSHILTGQSWSSYTHSTFSGMQQNYIMLVDSYYLALRLTWLYVAVSNP